MSTDNTPPCPRCGGTHTHDAGGTTRDYFTCERCLFLFERHESEIRVERDQLAEKIARMLPVCHETPVKMDTPIVRNETIIDERLTIDDLLYETLGYYS